MSVALALARRSQLRCLPYPQTALRISVAARAGLHTAGRARWPPHHKQFVCRSFSTGGGTGEGPDGGNRAANSAPSESSGAGQDSRAGGGGGQDQGTTGGAWCRFWAWTTQQRPSWRTSPLEAAVAFCVFGITGSTSVAVVRPFLKKTMGLEGSLKDGPWSYRIISLVVVSPFYAWFLVTFGTIAGRHLYFANMAAKIFGRFLPSAMRSRIRTAWCRVIS